MNRLRILAILSFLLCIYSISQAQRRVDSLRNALSKSVGRERIDITYQLAIQLTRTNLKESREMAMTSLEESRKIGYHKGEVESLIVLGTYYTFTSALEKGREAYEEAIVIAKRSGYGRGLVSANFSLGAYYIKKGLYARAVPYFSDSYHYSAESGRFDYELSSLMNLGIAKTELGELEAAEQYLQQALELGIEHEALFRLGQVYGNLGNLEFDRSNYTLSRDYHQKAYKMFKDERARLAQAISLIQLGRVNTKLGFNKKALVFFDSASLIRKSLGDELGLVSIMRYKAQTLSEMRRYEASQKIVDQALPVAVESKDYSLLKDLYVLAIDLAEERKDYRTGLMLFRALSEVRDSITTRANRKKVHQLSAQFDFDRLESEAMEQAQLNQINRLKLNQRNMTILSLFVLLSLLVVIFVLNQTRLKNRLAVTNQERAALAKESQKKQEEILRLTSFADGLLKRTEGHQTIDKKTAHLIEMLQVPHIQAKDWASYRVFFDQVFPSFFENLNQYDLTINDQRLASLIKLRLSTKEMSIILGITPKSVWKARSRLGVKMKFETSQQLDTFLLKL